MDYIDNKRLEARMHEMRISQAELARRVRVSQPTIHKLLNGDSKTSSVLHLIADELETTPAYLTNKTDDPSKGANPKPTEQQIKEYVDTIEITELDLSLGMGGMAILDYEIEERKMHFSRAWIANFTKAPASKLYFVRGMGDSMNPTIQDGDICLIDTSQTMPTMSDKIWAITFYGGGQIKRLRHIKDGYKIMSDNPNISDEIAMDGEMTVIGRVVAVMRKL